MAKPVIKVDVSPALKTVEKRLSKTYARIKDKRVVNKKISILLDQWVQRNFQSQGGKVGGWKPFKAGGRRLKGGYLDNSAKLLQDTGDLRKSFLPFATKTTVGIGSKLPYSKYHEEGTNTLPVRRMLPRHNADDEIIRKTQKALELHVQKALNK